MWASCLAQTVAHTTPTIPTTPTSLEVTTPTNHRISLPSTPDSIMRVLPEPVSSPVGLEGQTPASAAAVRVAAESPAVERGNEGQVLALARWLIELTYRRGGSPTKRSSLTAASPPAPQLLKVKSGSVFFQRSMSFARDGSSDSVTVSSKEPPVVPRVSVLSIIASQADAPAPVLNDSVESEDPHPEVIEKKSPAVTPRRSAHSSIVSGHETFARAVVTFDEESMDLGVQSTALHLAPSPRSSLVSRSPRSSVSSQPQRLSLRSALSVQPAAPDSPIASGTDSDGVIRVLESGLRSEPDPMDLPAIPDV